MIIPVNTAKQFAALPADYHLRKNMVTAETVISVFHTNLPQFSLWSLLAFTQFIIQTLYAAHQGGISACRKSMFVYKMKRCTVQFISPRTPPVSA